MRALAAAARYATLRGWMGGGGWAPATLLVRAQWAAADELFLQRWWKENGL